MSKSLPQPTGHKAKQRARVESDTISNLPVSTVKGTNPEVFGHSGTVFSNSKIEDGLYRFPPVDDVKWVPFDNPNALLIARRLAKAKLDNEVDKTSSDTLAEQTRLTLLDAATKATPTVNDPLQAFEDRTRSETVTLLGGESVLGRTITNDQELLEALIHGFPADVLRALRESGIPHNVFEQIVAPRRTLMRRKAEGQRLTRSESDAVWRLANAYALAARVLNGRKAAIDWLTRAKPAFANQTPIDLLETSVGSAHVNRMLQRLEWGDVA